MRVQESAKRYIELLFEKKRKDEITNLLIWTITICV